MLGSAALGVSGSVFPSCFSPQYFCCSSGLLFIFGCCRSVVTAADVSSSPRHWFAVACSAPISSSPLPLGATASTLRALRRGRLFRSVVCGRSSPVRRGLLQQWACVSSPWRVPGRVAPRLANTVWEFATSPLFAALEFAVWRSLQQSTCGGTCR